MDEWRKRLQKRMRDVGMTPAELTRAAGVGPTMVHDIINRNSNPSVQNLSKIAKSLGITVAFLLEGDNANRPLTIAIHGINKGGDMIVPVPASKPVSAPIELLDENCIFSRIDTDTFGKVFRPGDVIGGPRITAQFADNYVGQECIIRTTDGAEFIRILMRGARKNTYNLRSFNPLDEDIKDVRLEWIAPVKFIFRA